MKKLFVLIAIIAIPSAVFYSCQHEPVLPEEQVSFSTDIMPIIQQGCWHAGCHGDSLNSEFKLSDYQKIMDRCDVVAGKPQRSGLYQVITTTSGENKMPQEPYPSLTERQIKLIYIWIAQGAKNN